MNRQMRRFAEAHHRKEIRKVIKGEVDWTWKDGTLDFVNKWVVAGKNPSSIAFFKHNQMYSVQSFVVCSDIFLIGIRRHDQSSDIPWSHKQRIKSELFSPETLAIECYPKESELVDSANIFWLFVIKKEIQSIPINMLNLEAIGGRKISNH